MFTDPKIEMRKMLVEQELSELKKRTEFLIKEGTPELLKYEYEHLKKAFAEQREAFRVRGMI